MKMFLKIIDTVTVLIVLFLMSGCAAAPASIAPMQISESKYSNYDCDQLSLEQDKLTTELTMYSMTQEQTKANDALGVFMLGLPLGSMSGGNKAPEISMLKGEIKAIHIIGTGKDCNLQFPQIAEYKEPKETTLPEDQRHATDAIF